MIQIHKVADLEVAISMGVLLPHDAPPKSRHRFWVADRRLDAYLNADKVLFLHWVRREVKGGKVVSCGHPHADGFKTGIIYPSGMSSWYYPGSTTGYTYTNTFKMSEVTE